MGRLKRNKTYRKCLQFYELNFGIRKPYRLVLDGNFMHTACRNGVLLRDKLPSMLGDPEAELLVRQTFLGAIELYNASDLSCEEWIERVCSRGGTTEAALGSYRKNLVHNDIKSGAQAALLRAVELGKEA